MIFYISLLLFSIILALIIKNSKTIKNKKTLFLVIYFSILILLASIRDDSVGTDYYSYLRYYFLEGKTGFSHINDAYPGFSILCKILFRLTHTDLSYRIFMAVFTQLGIAIYLNYFSPDALFSSILYLLLYFYPSSFNGARYMLALNLLLIGVVIINLNKNKAIKLIGLFIIAYSISVHYTIVLAIPLLFFICFKCNKKHIRLTIAAIVFMAIFSDKILNFVIKTAGKLIPHYSMYTRNSSFLNAGKGRYILLILAYALFLILLIYEYYINERHINSCYSNINIPGLICIGIIGIYLGIAGNNNLMLQRIGNYYNIFFIIIIPEALKFIKPRKVAKLLTTIVFFVPYFYQLYANFSGVVPYLTMF